MKKDNSNPKRSSSITINEQENITKTASTTSKPLDYHQKENNLHSEQSHILSHTDKNNNEIIDDVKVAEIKQAINEGRFKVNSEKIADRLLEVVKELIQSKRKK